MPECVQDVVCHEVDAHLRRLVEEREKLGVVAVDEGAVDAERVGDEWVELLGGGEKGYDRIELCKRVRKFVGNKEGERKGGQTRAVMGEGRGKGCSRRGTSSSGRRGRLGRVPEGGLGTR